AEVVAPEEALPEVHFRDDDLAPLLGVHDRHPVMAIDGSQAPLAGIVVVGAADEMNVVLARSRTGQERIASPDRPGDHLGDVLRWLPRDLGEEAVVADHHADLADRRVEDGILLARTDSAIDFAARQADLAILADDASVGPDHHGDVVDKMPVALDQ